METLKKIREHAHLWKVSGAVAAIALVVALFAAAQTPPPGAQSKSTPAKSTPAKAKAAPAKANAAGTPAVAGKFLVHAKHAKELMFDCDTCHVADKPGSVIMKRPGHDQCMGCHQDAWDKLDVKYCSVCHTDYPPTSAEGLIPFPNFKAERAVLFDFSHAKHVDPKARLNAQTGFRSDCTFCHKFEPKGDFATFPGHAECTQCHSQAGTKPNLSAKSTSEDCRGCHNPEEIENPGFTTERRMVSARMVAGKYINLKYSHAAHFKVKDEYKLDCTTCHYAIPASTSLADLTLPKMIDCVGCHDTAKNIDASYRMANCSTCHIEPESGVAPSSHTRNVKPAFHTDNFRQHHEAEAKEPGAKCFVCHLNVKPGAPGINAAASTSTTGQCAACHMVMMPVSHTGRWKDDIHGKFAAIDRESCALCHTSDSCSQCHNQVPPSHAPLALYAAGTHAFAARLDERSCFTCHSFQNTCAQCHTK